MIKEQHLHTIVVMILCIMISLSAPAQEIAKPVEPKALNVNFATLEELQALPGVGETLAQIILAERPYASAEGLLMIPGIDEKLLADIQTLITTDKLNVNTASMEDLLLVPGFTQELAEMLMQGVPYLFIEDIFDILEVKVEEEEDLEIIKEYIDIQFEKKQQDDTLQGEQKLLGNTRGRKSRSKKPGASQTP